MTQKRFRKLCMSIGMSRNQANDIISIAKALNTEPAWAMYASAGVLAFGSDYDLLAGRCNNKYAN